MTTRVVSPARTARQFSDSPYQQVDVSGSSVIDLASRVSVEDFVGTRRSRIELPFRTIHHALMAVSRKVVALGSPLGRLERRSLGYAAVLGMIGESCTCRDAKAAAIFISWISSIGYEVISAVADRNRVLRRRSASSRLGSFLEFVSKISRGRTAGCLSSPYKGAFTGQVSSVIIVRHPAPSDRPPSAYFALSSNYHKHSDLQRECDAVATTVAVGAAGRQTLASLKSLRHGRLAVWRRSRIAIPLVSADRRVPVKVVRRPIRMTLVSLRNAASESMSSCLRGRIVVAFSIDLVAGTRRLVPGTVPTFGAGPNLRGGGALARAGQRSRDA